MCLLYLFLKLSYFLPVFPFLIFVAVHTCFQCVHTHTHTPALPLAVTARVNLCIVWPACQALIPECLQAAEGKELKVSVCKGYSHTYAGRWAAKPWQHLWDQARVATV